MSEILAFYAANHAEIHEIAAGVLLFLNVLVTFMLRLAPLQNWLEFAEKNPRVAAFVRLLGALGIQPLSILQALLDILRGTASKGTLASAKSLQVSVASPVISPADAGVKKVSP